MALRPQTNSTYARESGDSVSDRADPELPELRDEVVPESDDDELLPADEEALLCDVWLLEDARRFLLEGAALGPDLGSDDCDAAADSQAAFALRKQRKCSRQPWISSATT